MCEIIFHEDDEEDFRNAPIFNRKIRYGDSDQPIQNVYNFYTLNKKTRKPFRANEDSFMSSVFGSDSVNTTTADRAAEESKTDVVQRYVFENVVPGDFLALRVEVETDKKLTQTEKWMLKQKKLREENYDPKKTRLSLIGTTVESIQRVEPK